MISGAPVSRTSTYSVSFQTVRLGWGACCVTAALLLAALGFAQPLLAQERQIVLKAAGDVQAVNVTISKTLTVRINADFMDLVAGDKEIADILPLTNRSLYILGKRFGRTNIAVYDDKRDLIGLIDVDVSMDIGEVNKALRAAVPNGRLTATLVNGRIQLGGRVADGIGLRTALDIVQQFSPDPIINTVQVIDAQQVMLEVRFLEVNRDAGRQLGVGLSGDDVVLGTGKIPSGSPFGTLITNVLAAGVSVDILVEALETKDLARTLAEPNLVAQSGETASFLAGGEFPFTVCDVDEDRRCTTQFKEHGVRLVFTPTVLNDGLINLEIEQEVSQIEFRAGEDVPALLTRRAKTTVELRDGQSFAIAGLLQATNDRVQSQVPWLGQIPILGALFRSSSFQKHESELVILITVHLVRPARPGEALYSPLDNRRPSNDKEFFLLGLLEITDRDIQRFMHGQGIDGAFGHIIERRPKLLRYPPEGGTGVITKN